MTDKEAIDALAAVKNRLIQLTKNEDLDPETIKEINNAIFEIGIAELHPAFVTPF